MSPLDFPRRRKPVKLPGKRWVSEQGAGEPPAPIVTRSPWEGRWFFSAHDPLRLDQTPHTAQLLDLFDGIVLKADGDDRAEVADADWFRERGKRVAVWEALAQRGQEAVGTYGGELYVPQVEGPDQLEAARRVRASVRVPQGPVSNVTFTGESWCAEWDAILCEAYLNVDQNQRPDVMQYEALKRGAKLALVVPGLYDGSSEQPGGRRVELDEYAVKGADLGSVWPYTIEYLTDYSIGVLRSLRRVA